MANETTTPYDRLLKYFKYDHLPPHLKQASKSFSDLAHQVAERATVEKADIGEVMAGLRKLLEAKDCVVRALV